jgi:hypothetical protein
MNERENSVLKNERYVYCPPFECDDDSSSKELSLSNAKPVQLWEYEKKIAELDSLDKKVREKFQQERDSLKKIEEMEINLMKFIENDAYGEEKPLDEEVDLICVKYLLNLVY